MANGLAVMRDVETESLWDHYSGECFSGRLKGVKLEFWPVDMTITVAALQRDGEMILYRSNQVPALFKLAAVLLGKNGYIHNKSYQTLPPYITNTMHENLDHRLPLRTQGLGVIDVSGHTRFYPLQTLSPDRTLIDEWHGRSIRITTSVLDGVPKAAWVGQDQRPMQWLTRWYGFSITYPNCDIYAPD